MLPVVIKPKQNGKFGCTLTLSKPFLLLLFSCYAVSNPFTTQWTVANFLHPRDSPGQNTGVGSLSFLQGIFPTQGLNPSLPHCREILFQLSHKGSLFLSTS